MKHYRLISFFTIVTLLAACQKDASFNAVELNQGWHFKNEEDSVWRNATIPGTVHTDLIDTKQIEDPYYRLNEHNLQWIDKTNWEYKTTFNVSTTELSKQKVELEFLGLDTYTKIHLNDSLILKTDNMFRNYTVEVKELLKEGKNQLHILFESPIQKGIEKHDALGYKSMVSDNDLAAIGKVEGQKQVSIFTRKAGYHFGWDWGPRLVTSGIWKPLLLRSWNHHMINDLFVQQDSISEKANLTAYVEVEALNENKKTKIELLINKTLTETANVQLAKGKNVYKIPFEIHDPKLWWPNGMSEQILYDIEVVVTSDAYVDKKSRSIGLRTIELVTEADSIGNAFYFKVNGHPTFMKGANYIPQNIFLPSVKRADYEHILNSAKEANMNMIRVWGGGIYENDEFYDMCDEKGLLIWQDFMFACAMFPGDEAFLDNVKQEAIQNVKRLRNHPSIALWCGNNEILSAWENWGWKNQVTENQSKEVADTIWKAYDDLFHKILPTVVNNYDSTRTYWPSSPGSAFGEKESFEKGDAHYWKVWWGKQPFDNYNAAIPRFMSEFGFQSFPELATVEKYTLPEDHDVYSEVMKSHQRSSIGNATVEEYMLRNYKQPKDFASFLYVSQLLQSHGITIGIEAHRRNRHRCMGSLYWQINDCWPVASWSSIDSYGKWKALHYNVKKAFKTTLISFTSKQNATGVYVVSDSLKNFSSTLDVRLIDFDGNELKHWEKQGMVEANKSMCYIDLPKEELDEYRAGNVFLHARLLTEKELLAENLYYLAPFKDLSLVKPELTYAVSETKNEFKVSLKTKKMAIGVFLSSASSANFSDNYFDMPPNSEKTVTVPKGSSERLASFRENLKVFNLTDSYSDESL